MRNGGLDEKPQVRGPSGTSVGGRRSTPSTRRSWFSWVGGSIAFPLLVFGGTRLLVTAFVLFSAGRQVALPTGLEFIFMNHPKPAHPDYWEIVTNWDGQWYESIAVNGYQVASGESRAAMDSLWAWSFPPLYPMLVKLVMTITTLSFAHAASFVSLACGGAAMVMLHRHLERSGGRRLARVGVLMLCCFTSAPLFQFAYTESLSLLLLMIFFWALSSRRYVWAAIAVVALSFTRLITPPLAIVIAAHAWQRYRHEGRVFTRQRASLVVLGSTAMYAVVGAFAWLAIASMFVGTESGLARTRSQRSLHLGWFGDALEYSGVVLLVLVILILAILLLVALSRRSAPWGLELRAWSFAYPLFLSVATTMHPGILRYLLLSPTLPLLLVGKMSQPRRGKLLWVAAVCLLLLASQYWFVSHLLVIDRHVKAFGP